MEEVHYVSCPACWSTLPVLVEAHHGTQSFVEDCSVCCNPMQIVVRVKQGRVTSVQVEPA